MKLKRFVIKINSHLALLMSVFSLSCFSQIEESNNNVGFKYLMKSEVLEEERQVQIFLPSSYSSTDQSYPVLYLLDGQRFFLYGVSLLESFRQYRLTPEFIVVGITNSYPQRFGHFGDGKDRFTDFIRTELIPFVEENYRANNERLLFGWEYGGSLGFHLLVDDPALFDGYFLASPFPIKEKVDELDSISVLEKTLVFSVSANEFAVNHGVDRLDSLLSKKNIDGLDWSYLKLPTEEHRSTPYPTLYHGMRSYFKYYPELQVDDFDQFIKDGALDYALEYGEKRSSQFGFPDELSTWTKFTIIRSAMRADNYEYFSSFIHDLNLDEFIRELSSYRINSLGTFYEKNDKFDEAIEIYKILLEKNPDSEMLLNKIGNAHVALNKHQEAERYFKRASEASQED